MKTRLLRLAGTEAGKAIDEDDKRRMWKIISLRKVTPNFHLSNVSCNSNFAYCPLQTSPPRSSFSTSPLSLPSLLLLPSSLKGNFTCACAPVWFWSDWLFRSLLIPQAAASRITKRKISFFFWLISLLCCWECADSRPILRSRERKLRMNDSKQFWPVATWKTEVHTRWITSKHPLTSVF